MFGFSTVTVNTLNSHIIEIGALCLNEEKEILSVSVAQL